MNANIVGTGIYVPEKIVTNDDLSRILDEDINEFVTHVLGIHERHVCAENESTADLATNAGRQALENAGIDAAELDLIILATVGEDLRKRYGVADVVFRRKEYFSKPASAQLIDEMAKKVQVAVAAVGG